MSAKLVSARADRGRAENQSGVTHKVHWALQKNKGVVEVCQVYSSSVAVSTLYNVYSMTSLIGYRLAFNSSL